MRSIAAGEWTAWSREDLAPHRDWMAEQIREKVRRHLYGWSHFWVRIEVRSLQKQVASLPIPSFCGRKNKWSEGRMLHFAYPLCVYSPSRAFCSRKVSDSCWREHGGWRPVHLLKSPTPHSVCRDVQPRPVLWVGSCSRWLVWHSWLQVRFDAHFITYFCEEVGHEIVNFIVPDGGKTFLGTWECCSTVKLLLQSHLDGRFEGYHPYRRAVVSWKAALCNEKPCSCKPGGGSFLLG